MTNWQDKIPGCFAGVPSPFAAPFGTHPNDCERAKKMLYLALREGASFDEVIRETRRWLKQHGASDKAIEDQVEKIKRFHPNPFMKRKLGAAWLVTWEGTLPSPAQCDRIASIMDYRLSDDRIIRYIEQLYVDRCYSLHEKILYARRRADNPYPGKKARLGFICGHNPFLWARKVKNLRFYIGESNQDVLMWDDTELV